MKLYHGTNGHWLQNILRKGLEPRGRRATRDNWKHVAHRSNPRCVYLTNSYAPYFACNAERSLCAVVEVETDRLNPVDLFPDEDFLEQASRRVQDPVPGTMSQRTLHYRARQFEYGDDATAWDQKNGVPLPWWRASLKYLGTAAYRGTIPPAAITRAVLWPHEPNRQLLFVWDPSISLINQLVCGDRYHALTARLFGDPIIQNLSEFDRRALGFPLTGGTRYARTADGVWTVEPWHFGYEPTEDVA